jgi:peptide/nickel transport system permease protein
VFLLLQLAPGDTVDALMAQMGGGDAATAHGYASFMLDFDPVQLGNYLAAGRLDLFSSIYGKPVASGRERLPTIP